MSWRGKQHVYFAEACGKIKIGCSHNPEGRLVTVGEWIPFPITLLATVEGGPTLESALHRMFDEEWSHGEWFEPSPRLRALIANAYNGVPINIDAAAIGTRRRAFIAEKKRLTHRLNRLRKAGGKLPAKLDDELSKVRQGIPIPPELLARVNAFIDAYLTSDERTVGRAA